MLRKKNDPIDTQEKNTLYQTNTDDDEEEKNHKKSGAFLSNTFQDFSSGKQKPPELSYFTKFQGFFNKKFNLTSFKQKRDDSRSRSQSLERIINPHKIKGNGIPTDIISRMKFLGKIFDSPKFKKFMKLNIFPIKGIKFNELSDKILKFSKKNSQLEGIMMAYYYICHQINYDYTFLERNEDYKKSQTIGEIFKHKRALALGFTNLFEALMKKLEVKCKHIEGYCKLMPDRIKYLSYNNNEDNSNNNNTSNFNNYNISINNTKENFNNKNNSIVFTMYNNSSIINSKGFGISKTLTKLNLYNDIENENDLSNYINHCWNAFYYKGEWYFVDTVLGSYSFDKEKIKSNKPLNNNSDDQNIIYNNNEENKKFANFNSFFFMVPPELLINTHLPGNDSWQMTKKFCTLKQFLSKRLIDYGKFYNGLFKYDIELLTHQNPFIQINIKDKLVIKLKIFSYLIEAHLYDFSGLHKINEIRYYTDSKHGMFYLEPQFPKIGEYIIRINIRAINSTDLVYNPLFDYVVKVTNNISFNHFEKYKKIQQARNEQNKIEDNLLLPKIGYNKNNKFNTFNKQAMTFSQGRIITDYNKIFPSKKNKVICYDNEGFILYEPKTIYLKIGMNTKFKIKLKGAHSVLLLDGNKWTPLKRTEDNIFEGQKEIKTENVSICCLKNKNVFTEVFRFKIKKKIYFSKSFGLTHRKLRNKTINTIKENDFNINNIKKIDNNNKENKEETE